MYGGCLKKALVEHVWRVSEKVTGGTCMEGVWKSYWWNMYGGCLEKVLVEIPHVEVHNLYLLQDMLIRLNKEL
jgi:hypothetical protein